MRYIADSDGYIMQISFGADISCNGVDCVEYTGAVPSPYSSLESWYQIALNNNELCYWRIVDGNLTWSYSADRERGDYPVPDGLSYGNYTLDTDTEVDAILQSHISDNTFKGGGVRHISIYANSPGMTLPYGWRYFIELCKSSERYGVITAKSYHSSGPRIMRRQWYNGTLGEWEWENPPMSLDVEYRTTERYDGKPVFVKKIDFGALPNNSTASVPYGGSGATTAIRCSGTWGGNSTLPYAYNTQRAEIYANAARVYITTNFDMSAYSATATVWFVKS